MTQLSASPMLVAAVQAATTLPIFLFALLAGALADILDRRRLLLIINLVMGISAACMATLAYIDAITPALLLIFTFMLGTGAAFAAPAWQSIVPSLVPKAELSQAIALNSMGINISRAVGPAIAGSLIVAMGLYAPFLINALSFIGIIAALIWWKPVAKPVKSLPPEHVGGAIVAGLRYTVNSKPVMATLIKAIAFFVFASAYWAMLPLIAKTVLNGGATLYGILLGCVGAGAVLGAILLPVIKKRLGADKTVFAGAMGTATVMLALTMTNSQPIAAVAAGLGGLSWIAVLSSFNVSVQTALPDWARARGLSVFLTVFFGSMSGGSLVWGQIATVLDIATALQIAAAGIVAFMLLTWRVRLNQGMEMDLAPSMHWQEVTVKGTGHDEGGSVMIRVTYLIDEADLAAFMTEIHKLRFARKRNGGYNWSVLQDSEHPERLVETWFEASWLDHLRHHERVSGEDRLIQDAIAALHRGDAPPRVEHFLSVRKAGSEK